MANEKKPSIYSDRGNIGSAEELDEYGVWVKSEPQVISSGVEAQKPDDFDDSMFNTEEISSGDASGFEDVEFPVDSSSEENLETSFDDFTVSDSSGVDLDIPTVRSIENNIENIQSDFESGNLSTQLLKKIASELSSIRGELHDLKKEFANVRAAGDKEGFFSEEDDEKIALTGDEMDDILTTSDGTVNDNVEIKTMANILGEDEDETIALTGDEMDNILNSADFTEEAGTNETSEDELSDYDDETIALTGDEMDNILNSADFTEEAGTEESTDNGLSADLNDVNLEMSDTAETDSSLSGLDFDDFSETTASEDISIESDIFAESDVSKESDVSVESGAAEESDVSVESDLTMDDFDMSALEDDASADSGIAEEDAITSESELAVDDFDMSALESGVSVESDVSAEDGAAEESDLTMDNFDMSALESDAPAEDAVSIEDEVSEEDGVISESELAIDDFDMSALDEDVSADSGAVEESEVSEEEGILENALTMDDFDMSALEDDASADSGAVEESDVADDVFSLDDSGDSGSELAMDDFDMSALDNDLSTESDISEESAVDEESAVFEESETSEGEEKKEYIDIDIADLGVNLDDEQAADSFAEESEESLDLSTDISDESAVGDESAISDESAEMDFDITKDSEELEELREKGATPLTFPPENSSYLEEDDQIDLDLSEAVIDEPELSTKDIDEPLSEPSLDIDSIDDLGITSDTSLNESFDTSSLDESSLDESSLDASLDVSSLDGPSIDNLDIDIDIPPEDEEDLALSDEQLLGSEDMSIDDHIISEGFEAEIQETPVPLDEDIEEDITLDESLEAAEAAQAPAKPAVTAKAAPAKPMEPESIDTVDTIEEIGEIGEIDDIGEIADIDEAPPAKAQVQGTQVPSAPAGIAVQKGGNFQLPSDLKKELKNILSYMDQLLESLPEEKIEEFAKSEYFDSYKKLFKELGLV
jgi:hypothetical protein